MAGAGVRRGGRAALPSGELIVWSVADGRRGRRWREVSSRSGRVARAVLLETDPTGRLTRLEVSTAAGLLTLHPDDTGRVLHGNVVTASEIRHLALDRTAVLVDGSPATTAVLVGPLVERVGVGATTTLDVVRVDDRLEPRAASVSVSRVDPATWRLVAVPQAGTWEGGDPGDWLVRLDADGLPDLAGDAWPLEI